MSQGKSSRPAETPPVVYTAEQAASLITRYQSVRKPHPFDGRCPYVGAAPFRESDARLYFGHENQLEALLDHIEHDAKFICISGPAKSGKTSLIQAGLTFALRNGAIMDSDAWPIQTLTPGDAPLRRLTEACAGLGERAGLHKSIADAIRQHGLTSPGDMRDFVDALLGADARRRLVLVIDQFEDVFTAADDAERRAFIGLVAQLAKNPPARLILILAMRSEFLDQLARYPELHKQFTSHMIELPLMEPKELARAIVLPALETGATIEPALVARLVNDVYGEPDMLPKLQTILRNLFMAIPVKRGAEKTLLLADYIDFGPLREREGDRLPAPTDEQAPAIQRPLREALGEQRAVSHFARQEARLRLMKTVTAIAAALGALAIAFGAFGLAQRAQFSQQADAAATAEAIAQADATRAIQTASAAGFAQSTAEAQATRAEQERQIAVATRTAAEAAATQSATERRLALDERATAIAIATSVVNRERNAVMLEATISAVATQSSIQARDALAAKATAEANLSATRSRELAAVALNQLADDPQLALLIAIEAEQAAHTAQSEDALRLAMARAFRDDGVFRHPAAVTDAQLSADGKYLLTASRDGVARLWDIASGEVITAFRGHLGQVTSAAFSPVGRQIATSSTDRTARVWNLDTGRTITVLVGHTGVVNDAAFSPDGKLLATGGADRTVRVWDLASGAPFTNPIQLGAVVSQVVFLEDGVIGVLTANGAERFDLRTGLSAGAWSRDGLPQFTRLPDGALAVQRGSTTVTLYGHTAPAAVADARADRIVTVSADGTARMHLLRMDALIERARSLLGRELTCEERVRFLNEVRRCPAS
ncbi:MAG: WD40 repeat domain-containing protein [Anaerolineae bacterium]|nr:WD40 repeat domain-containing protein [Candidatus Roseilinea sp.]MDW8450038.1 WD40 repeat domain-containing protein [Anaerolineae bacterium]